MDDHDRRFSRPGDGPADPVSSLLGSLTELWGKGLSALQVLAPTVEGASFDAMFPRGRPGAPADAGPVSQLADMSPAIAQAGIVAAASTLRYWRTLAELQARYQSSLMQAVADRGTGQAAAVSPADSRVLADELRAFLREVGDAAMQEARRLQHELEQVGESIAQVADQATPSPHYDPDHQERPHRRPHHVKE